MASRASVQESHRTVVNKEEVLDGPRSILLHPHTNSYTPKPRIVGEGKNTHLPVYLKKRPNNILTQLLPEDTDSS